MKRSLLADLGILYNILSGKLWMKYDPLWPVWKLLNRFRTHVGRRRDEMCKYPLYIGMPN